MDKIMIIGNLTKDVEINERKGYKVANFSVAVNGRKGAPAKFFRATAWNGAADTIAKYAHKGSKMYLDGEITTSAYIDKNGNPQATMELNVQNFQFLGNSDYTAEAEAPAAPKAVAQPTYQNATAPTYNYDAPVPDAFTDVTDEDDDLPF